MGLGGYLTWTAAAREIKARTGTKSLPIEQHGNFVRIIQSEIFENSDLFYCSKTDESKNLFPLILNNPAANYCKQDLADRAVHRPDKHIIEQICEVYGINDPVLKCELKISKDDKSYIDSLYRIIDSDKKIITIEPSSKENYTKNRVYPFKKWQAVVDVLSKDFTVIQLGNKNSAKLNNAFDLRGRTTFKQAVQAIKKSSLFMSTEGGLVHGATAAETTSLVIITGYQDSRMVAYPQNINVDISSHGPCGLKSECPDCIKDAADHNYEEIIDKAREFLCQ